jgi:aryl-phospho-beta-D-glucosidase BglC (GH1 family)
MKTYPYWRLASMIKTSHCAAPKRLAGLVLFTLFVLAWFPSSVLAVTATPPPCNETFSFSGYRGINLSLHTNPTLQDFEKIASWGANLVRLVIHADPTKPQYRNFYNTDLSTIKDGAFTKLDQIIGFAAKTHIKVVIDLHTAPGSDDGSLWTNYRYWDAFERLWAFIAERYKDNPTIVGFDLLNEPTLATVKSSAVVRLAMQQGHWTFPADWRETPRDYFALMTRVARTINRISPTKAIIIEGVGLWGNPVNFTWMEPIDACNVVYSFHMYVPHKFTHAGSGNISRDVSYDRPRQRPSILASIEPVVRFARKYQVPVFVGEFGLNYFNEGRGASAWLDDVVGIFESNGWSWSYWTYSIDFRNPEFLMTGTSLVRNQSTERLTTLKKYWLKNKIQKPANRP